MKALKSLILTAVTWLITFPATADGIPKPWQLGFQDAATPVQVEVNAFHNMMLWIITAIVIIVCALLFYTLWRYRARRNPNPSKTTHNVLIEVLWTLVPCLILMVVAIPSFRLMYFMDRTETPEMTIKAVGYQWYWGYEYMDEEFDGLTFSSYMIKDEDINESAGEERLLEVDNKLVVPVNTNIRVLVTADPGGVIHSWAVPAFGIKTDAVPGRISETWMRITKPGTYYGQCSEICGILHGYMPIQIEAVPRDEFDAWVEKAKEEFG